MDVKTCFEALPNEIWLCIFQFIKTNNLGAIFYGLNSRCNALVIQRMRKYGYDFRSISKLGFESACHALRSDAAHVRKLCLSDDDETPFQTQVFLAKGFTFQQFISLTHLSLFGVRSKQTWTALMNAFSHLTNLTRLKLIDGSIDYDQSDGNAILSTIWRLPKLAYADLDIYSDSFMRLLGGINTHSSTLRFVKLHRSICRLDALQTFFRYTRQLKNLVLHTDSMSSYSLSTVMPSLTSLTLDVYCNDMIGNILSKTPNLCNLKVEVSQCVYGYQWERLIRVHLPELQTFHMKMTFTWTNGHYNKYFKELFTSFTGDFWLKQRRWYVRFHCDQQNHNCINCYTLPYAFSEYHIVQGCCRGSTCPNENDYWSYDSVETLSYNDTFLEQTSQNQSLIQFPNVRDLHVLVGKDPVLCSIVPQLEKLESLLLFRVKSETLVETLLAQTSQLHSLTLDTYGPLFALAGRSIRRLELRNLFHHNSEEQIRYIIESQHISNCEILIIHLRQIENIQPFLQKLPNLRALAIGHIGGLVAGGDVSKDSRVDLLRSYLPSTAIVERDTKYGGYIRAWIR